METAQPAPGEKIIVRCPRSLRVAFVLVGLFGATYLADSLFLGGPFPTRDLKLFIVAIIMVIAAPVALLFVFNVRVEIDGEHIAKYRGSRLLRRAGPHDSGNRHDRGQERRCDSRAEKNSI